MLNISLKSFIFLIVLFSYSKAAAKTKSVKKSAPEESWTHLDDEIAEDAGYLDDYGQLKDSFKNQEIEHIQPELNLNVKSKKKLNRSSHKNHKSNSNLGLTKSGQVLELRKKLQDEPIGMEVNTLEYIMPSKIEEENLQKSNSQTGSSQLRRSAFSHLGNVNNGASGQENSLGPVLAIETQTQSNTASPACSLCATAAAETGQKPFCNNIIFQILKPTGDSMGTPFQVIPQVPSTRLAPQLLQEFPAQLMPTLKQPSIIPLQQAVEPKLSIVQKQLPISAPKLPQTIVPTASHQLLLPTRNVQEISPQLLTQSRPQMTQQVLQGPQLSTRIIQGMPQQILTQRVPQQIVQQIQQPDLATLTSQGANDDFLKMLMGVGYDQHKPVSLGQGSATIIRYPQAVVPSSQITSNVHHIHPQVRYSVKPMYLLTNRIWTVHGGIAPQYYQNLLNDLSWNYNQVQQAPGIDVNIMNAIIDMLNTDVECQAFADTENYGINTDEVEMLLNLLTQTVYNGRRSGLGQAQIGKEGWEHIPNDLKSKLLFYVTRKYKDTSEQGLKDENVEIVLKSLLKEVKPNEAELASDQSNPVVITETQSANLGSASASSQLGAQGSMDLSSLGQMNDQIANGFSAQLGGGMNAEMMNQAGAHGLANAQNAMGLMSRLNNQAGASGQLFGQAGMSADMMSKFADQKSLNSELLSKFGGHSRLASGQTYGHGALGFMGQLNGQAGAQGAMRFMDQVKAGLSSSSQVGNQQISKLSDEESIESNAKSGLNLGRSQFGVQGGFNTDLIGKFSQSAQDAFGLLNKLKGQGGFNFGLGPLGAQIQGNYNSAEQVGAQAQRSLNSVSQLGSQAQSSLNSASKLGAQLQGNFGSASQLESQTQGILNSAGQIETLAQNALNSASQSGTQLQGDLNSASQFQAQFQGSSDSSNQLGAQGQSSLNSATQLGTQAAGSLNSASQVGAQLQGNLDSASQLGVQAQSTLSSANQLGAQAQGSLNSASQLGAQAQGNVNQFGAQAQNSFNAAGQLGTQGFGAFNSQGGSRGAFDLLAQFKNQGGLNLGAMDQVGSSLSAAGQMGSQGAGAGLSFSSGIKFEDETSQKGSGNIQAQSFQQPQLQEFFRLVPVSAGDSKAGIEASQHSELIMKLLNLAKVGKQVELEEILQNSPELAKALTSFAQQHSASLQASATASSTTQSQPSSSQAIGGGVTVFKAIPDAEAIGHVETTQEAIATSSTAATGAATENKIDNTATTASTSATTSQPTASINILGQLDSHARSASENSFAAVPVSGKEDVNAILKRKAPATQLHSVGGLSGMIDGSFGR